MCSRIKGWFLWRFNSAGQYVIQLMGNPSSAESQFDEVMVSEQVVVDSDNLAASEPPAA